MASAASEGLADPDGGEGARVDDAVLDEGHRAGVAVGEDGAALGEVVPQVQLGPDRQGRAGLVFGEQLEIVGSAPARDLIGRIAGLA